MANPSNLDNPISRGLREGALLVFTSVALFFLMALISFNLEDAGWTHSGAGKAITNSGGVFGAWISDFFLWLTGVMAYLFPVMIAYHGVLAYRGEKIKDNHWIVLMRWFGFFATIISGAALSYIHFVRSLLPLPGTSGGILGQEVGDALINYFGTTGATLFLLSIFFAGITFFTGFSWIGLMDRVGRYTIAGCHYLFVAAVWLISKLVVNNSVKKRNDDVLVPKKKTKSLRRIEPVLFDTKTVDSLETSKALPKIDYSDGMLPPLTLLDEHQSLVKGNSNNDLEAMSRQVELILREFGVEVEVTSFYPGPVITRFEIQPAAGVKVSRISTLSKDLARALSVPSVRIVEIIPGKPVIGLEIPNDERETVYLREVFASKLYQKSSSPLTLCLGKDISGNPVTADLAKMPHLLVAGTTGSGKSVAVNTMILSLLFKSTPEQVRLIMIDPKMLELSVYEGIAHLLTPVVIDMKDAANALRWSVAEMERRYRLMSRLGVRNLTGFNRKVKEANASGNPIKDPLFSLDDLLEGAEVPHLQTLPNIVIVIDELADMMMIVGKKVEELIARLAQKARAAGVHLILATQRPSVDVLTGLIKANVPTRIAFQVSSKIDSRTIIDQGGAETLLGNGDMLFLPPGTSIPNRVHGAFVDDHEVHNIVKFLKEAGPANYLDDITRESGEQNDMGSFENNSSDESDTLYDEAVRIVTETRRASISSVQRRLKVGYNRAARMIEDMEKAGVVTPPESNGSREVLAPPPPDI